MQLTNTPGKLVLPFANAGAKNSIPTASQIGITAGAASLTDGFPPLTRTPIAAGGVPPSGLDMNGILYELSAILRWVNAGGGYAYDAAFATDSNVGGYPKGARIMRSDGMGYWFNTVENNTTDPEAAGAAAAGWVPDFTNGVTSVAMASANVTLTPLQYGKPIIVITGTLTANLNLIFPNAAGEWVVINNTAGAFTVTCKTAAGTGVIVNTAQIIVGDATNIYAANNDATALLGANVASAGGTADALNVTLASTVRSWAQISGIPFWVRAANANTSTTPTFKADALAAKTIVKGANQALVPGDIAGAGHWLLLQYDASLDKWVLQNPAHGIKSGIYFVQVLVAANTTLTSSDLGKSFIGASETAFNITLPIASTCPPGNQIQFTNINAGAIGILRQGSDFINCGSEKTSVVLKAGDCVTLESGGSGGNWYVVNSSDGALQTLQSLSSSRAIATTYTNSTGRPIYVMFSALASVGGILSANINGTQILSVSAATNGYVNGTFKVLSGATYSITITSGTFSINTWWEIRS